ncbi:hypothetical protein [Tautonia sociabilis]|uniref:YHS domain-containing protein n=1 Tax=Tautonia sociabilis TaxID=2080755 RepID=A0A432MKP5_9BACT|nr:hypothetical protein [Tautonia sociabilis]RUL87982.1 hypothetical protein TsocGM_09675 [Tautonia sociabilis]
MAQTGIPIQHDGKTYFGYCQMYSGRIAADPERFTKAKDPITGVTMDKPTAFIYGFRGRAYYFESEATRGQFGKVPQWYAVDRRSKSEASVGVRE